MKVVYAFSVYDPNHVGPYPPSVMSSAWYQSIKEYVLDAGFSDNLLEAAVHSNNDIKHRVIFFFNTEESYEAFRSSHTLTDPDLLSDIRTWQLTHDVSYEHKLYSLTEESSLSLFTVP